MSETEERSEIERLIRHGLSPVPQTLRDAFYRYMLAQHGRFMLLINVIAQVAYLVYVIGDALAVPDVLDRSLQVRIALVGLSLPLVLAAFRWSRDVRLLDLLLPLLVLAGAALWFWVLSHSASPLVPTYVYASLIFIVLPNLAVRVRFLPAAALSVAISAVILEGVHRLSHGRADEMLVFVLAYGPVLFFSLFLSWSNALAGRRAFLRSVLEDRTRNALARANEQLREVANIDVVTGIGNRRQLDEQAAQFWDVYQTRGRRFALLLADVDFFKQFNDYYGHSAGDACLARVARALAARMREGEHFVGRYGGDEFAILVTADDDAAARRIAQRLVDAVERLDLPHVNRPDGVRHVTLSIGVAVVTGQTASLQQLTDAADAMLYRAKHQGRNQVCSA